MTSDVPVDSRELTAHAGVYELAPGFSLTVSREGARLLAQVTGQPKLKLFPESPTKFFAKEIDIQIEFVVARETAKPQAWFSIKADGSCPARESSRFESSK